MKRQAERRYFVSSLSGPINSRCFWRRHRVYELSLDKSGNDVCFPPDDIHNFFLNSVAVNNVGFEYDRTSSINREFNFASFVFDGSTLGLDDVTSAVMSLSLMRLDVMIFL